MLLFRNIILSLFVSLTTQAFARNWRNTDGTQSFQAEFISHDGQSVTLRRDQKILTVDIQILHSSDQLWLKRNHPIKKKSTNDPDATPSGSAFDTLEFGDTKNQVIEKLEKSKIVEGKIVKSLFARTGLNGIFRTKNDVGGLKCSLFFEWTDGGNLREVSLRTKGLAKETYYSSLENNWKEWINLLSLLYGKPIQEGGYPTLEDIFDGLILGSHLWYTEEGHSVILGTGQSGKVFSVVVRITSEHITPKAGP